MTQSLCLGCKQRPAALIWWNGKLWPRILCDECRVRALAHERELEGKG